MPKKTNVLLALCLIGFPLFVQPAEQVAPTHTETAELDELKKLLAEQKKRFEEQKRQLTDLERRIQALSTKQAPTTKPAKVASRPDSGTAPGVDKPVGKAPKAEKAPPPNIARISDDIRGVLTPKGNLVVEPSFKYAHTSANRVFLQGFGPIIVPSFFLGLIDIREIDRDIIIGALAARYGITSRLQFEAKVPYVYRSDSIRSRPFLTDLFGDDLFEATGSGIGDVEFAFDYQINDGLDGWPFFIGTVRVKTPTGTNPFEVESIDIAVRNADGSLVIGPDGVPVIERFPTELATGTGFWSVQPSLTFLYPSDPAVFFGTLSYSWNIEENMGTDFGVIDPGDTLGFSGGLGFGINETSSFSLGFSYKHVFETTQGGTRLNGSDLDIGQFLLGYSYRFSPGVNLNLTVGVGATDDAPDFELTIRLPTQFALF